MSSITEITVEITAPQGFLAGSADCGIEATKTDLTASHKADEAEADPGFKGGSAKVAASAASATGEAAPIKAAAAVIRVEAASFVKTGGKISWGGKIPNVLVHDSFGGGQQVYFQQQMEEQWADCTIEVPASGTYQITMKAARINEDQLLEVCSGGNVIGTVAIPPVPGSFGLWQDTPPVELKRERGTQTLRVRTPVSVNAENRKRGIALRSFELKPQP